MVCTVSAKAVKEGQANHDNNEPVLEGPLGLVCLVDGIQGEIRSFHYCMERTFLQSQDSAKKQLMVIALCGSIVSQRKH